LDLLIALPAAIGLGALHFLEPGHGKGVMTAYLISSRARLRDAMTLAFIAAASHTFSIFLLALIATSALQFLLPFEVEGWLGLVSGAIITLIGAKMVYQRLFPSVVSLGGLRSAASAEGAYVCEHGHVHRIGEFTGHEPHRSHPRDVDGFIELDNFVDGRLTVRRLQAASLRRLVSIGVLAGLIPCPSALAMLLTAASSGEVIHGIGLVVAFSLGGAASLSLLGILLLKAEKAVKFLEGRRISQLMATISALLIVVLGFLVTYESVLKLNLL
jgi:nickel/cobalt exporter